MRVNSFSRQSLQTNPACFLRARFLLLFYRLGEWTHECRTFARECWRMHVSQSCRKWQWSHADISFIRWNMTGLRAHDVAPKIRKCFCSRQGSFSRMIPRSCTSWLVYAKRWKLSEASYWRGFSYLKVNATDDRQ